MGALLVTTAEAASYSFQARRGNLVTLNAYNASSKAAADPSGRSLTLRARGIGGNVRRVFRMGLALGGGASYRLRDDAVRASGYTVQVQAGYALGSR